MSIRLDGETIVGEALRSIRQAEQTLRTRRRSQTPAALEARPTAPSAGAPAEARPTAGPGERIAEQAIRSKRALPELISRIQAADATNESAELSRGEFYSATLSLRNDLRDEIKSYVKESGASTSPSEINEATRGLQIQIKTVAAEVSGVDAIAEALGGVFDEFLSGLRGLLGVAIDALSSEPGTAPESDNGAAVAGEPSPADPSTVAPAFNISIPASELAQTAATVNPSAGPEVASTVAPAFAISTDALASADALAGAFSASETADAGDANESSDPESSALDALFDRLREQFASFQASFFGAGSSSFGIQVYSQTLNLTLGQPDSEIDATA